MIIFFKVKKKNKIDLYRIFFYIIYNKNGTFQSSNIDNEIQ